MGTGRAEDPLGHFHDDERTELRARAWPLLAREAGIPAALDLVSMPETDDLDAVSTD